ncbi:MAG: PAS domain S-box protein [Anaerolineae bacterium]|nr:PAS domain S-box protein [Anaerolineae bacterium]
MQQIMHSSPRESFWVRYAVATILPFIATFIAANKFMENTLYFPFMTAVMLGAWFGGFKSGAASLLISEFCIIFFLLEPYASFGYDPKNNLTLTLFGLCGLLVSWLQGRTKASTRALHLTNKQLETILNNMSEAVTVQNRQFQLLYVNEPAARLFKFPSPWQMIDMSLTNAQARFERFDEHGNPIPLSEVPSRKAFNLNRTSTLSYHLRYRDTNDDKWITQKSTPVTNALGDPEMLVNIFRDDTLQHNYETQIKKEHQALRDILDNLPLIVSMLTTDGIVIDVNRLTLQISNLNYTDMVGKIFNQLELWAYDASVQAQLTEAIAKAAQGENVRYDANLQIGQDRYMTIDLMLSPILGTNGKVDYILLSAIDITARKQIEMERAQLTLLVATKRQRLKAILDNIPGMVWETQADANGNQIPTFQSDYIQTLYGYTVEEAISNPNFWVDIVHPEDRERAIADAQAAYQNGGGIIQHRAVAKNGKVIHSEARIKVVYDRDEKPAAVFGLTMDITERKEAEDRLEKYAVELQRSNEELQQFAYVASHDLQEPLRMVMSFLQLLEQRYGDQLDQDAKEFIGFAVDGAARMKALINDLLMYSRVETAGKTFKQVDCQKILETVLRDLKLQIEEQQVCLTQTDLPILNVDEQQIKQLFQNLISNAIKFRSDHRKPEIHISAERKGKNWLFAVRDNGIGIEPQYRDRIFIIFQRLHGRKKYPGTGIGLAVCRKVVERHGGKIWVESQLGQETTFYFTLPAS